MIILRLLLLVTVLVVALSGGMYLFTRDPGYLRFAWQVVRFVVFLLLAFAVLFVLERYVLTGWGALL